MVQLVTQ